MHIKQLFETVSERIAPHLIDYFNPIIKKSKKKSILHGIVLTAAIGITLMLPKELQPCMVILFLFYPAIAYKEFCTYWGLKQLSLCIAQGKLPDLAKSIDSDDIPFNVQLLFKHIPCSIQGLSAEEIQQLFQTTLSIDDMKILSDAIKKYGSVRYHDILQIYNKQELPSTFSDNFADFREQYGVMPEKAMQTLLELNGQAVHNQRFNSKSVKEFVYAITNYEKYY